ncbi:hypothetical protein AYI70_g5174 [Smittium culicis]|uniref:Uncharacterized protein n=1 Tax=Smittium culicis TaxID=133412 RepID=A0A1R1XVR9_9FUNG|nr:hypothetical protein AYI70_g5174 [Smittium culicis]
MDFTGEVDEYQFQRTFGDYICAASRTSIESFITSGAEVHLISRSTGSIGPSYATNSCDSSSYRPQKWKITVRKEKIFDSDGLVDQRRIL